MKRFLYFALLGAMFAGNQRVMAEDVTVNFKGNKVDVKNNCRDSVMVDVQGGLVTINSHYKQHELDVVLKGKSDNGRLVITTKDKAMVTLDGLKLTSQEGAPIWLKNKKRVTIVAKDGTKNELCVAACPDTAKMKQAVIFSKDKLKFAGKGSLKALATADGCKGISSKKDITIDDLTLDVQTLNQNLGKDTLGFGGFGGFGGPGGFPGGHDGFGGMPPFGGGEGGFPGFDMSQMPEEMRKQFEEMETRMKEARERGEMPDFGGFGGGFGGFGGGFPGGGRPEGAPEGGFGGGFPGGGFGGFGGAGGGKSGDPDEGDWGFKQRYIGKTKGIKAMGQVIINSGKVYVKTISSGAEGIEGKKGVTVNGGEVVVDAIDDAINADAPIIFNGGKTIAESHGNDAVDANYGSGMMGFGPGMFGGQQANESASQEANDDPEKDAALIVRGGEVYAWSHVGSPEEGMDCDFSPFVISGGTIFTLGGGMGEMPSVPKAETAKQPTVLFIGLSLTKGEQVKVLDGDKTIFTFQAPCNYDNSATLFTLPALKLGKTYKIVAKAYEREFTLNEPFTTVR